MDNIEQIQIDVNNKFGIEISEEEVEAIITAQSRITKWGIENEQDIYWIYFGKFKIKQGRKGALLKSEEIRQTIINTNLHDRGIKRIGIGIKVNKEENKYGEGESIIKLE